MGKVGDSAGFLSNSCPSWLLDLSLCCNRFSGAYTWIVYALRTRPSDFFISYRRFETNSAVSTHSVTEFAIDYSHSGSINSSSRVPTHTLKAETFNLYHGVFTIPFFLVSCIFIHFNLRCINRRHTRPLQETFWQSKVDGIGALKKMPA